ncbi:hypothetical protein [uncultured Phycicoccus sp.]|uniref:hypothetical protein n=1 Tax=uncultured Phycicoccus sp. TaxID=661422 RepID=UPI00262FF690|nr:hypothetical protein [uncultured Phycicoccus sp.]
MSISDITQVLLTIAGIVVVLGPVVVLVELAHHRAQAEGRSVRGFPADPDDADARRVAGELRARTQATTPQHEFRGRRRGRVSGAR